MPVADAAEPVVKSVTEQLDALFAPWNRTDEPGLVVGVVKDGALIYRRGFGMASLEHAVANTPKTRMRIGSTSKHFTCLLASLLFGGASALGPALQSVGVTSGYYLFNAAPYVLTLAIIVATSSRDRSLHGQPAELRLAR